MYFKNNSLWETYNAHKPQTRVPDESGLTSTKYYSTRSVCILF